MRQIASDIGDDAVAHFGELLVVAQLNTEGVRYINLHT